jgi:hypothetical protein
MASISPFYEFPISLMGGCLLLFIPSAFFILFPFFTSCCQRFCFMCSLWVVFIILQHLMVVPSSAAFCFRGHFALLWEFLLLFGQDQDWAVMIPASSGVLMRVVGGSYLRAHLCLLQCYFSDAWVSCNHSLLCFGVVVITTI